MEILMKKFLLLFLTFALVSCANIPKAEEVPLDLSADEIIVLAQRETDKENYAGAMAYYEILATRFATDINTLNIAEFEMAHIYIKQKKYQKAHTLLNGILARFEGQGSALLKPEYKKLAEIDLKKIEDKIKPTTQDENQ